MENEKEIPSVEVPMIERRNPMLYKTRMPVEMSQWELHLIGAALIDSIKIWEDRLERIPTSDHEFRLSAEEIILFRQALGKRVDDLVEQNFPLPF